MRAEATHAAPTAYARFDVCDSSLRVILAVFFLSSARGLIYQVVWFRKLGLIFGVTSYALGVVLAAFMAGLAIGGLLGGMLAERSQRHLRLYTLAEVAIGVLGLVSIWALDMVQLAYVLLAGRIFADPAPVAGVHFALALAVLLPPTVCMGATLPLLARATGSLSRSNSVSQLYSANTAGAVVGAFVAGSCSSACLD